MADRIVLCIEQDTATVAEIRRGLASYGLRIESMPNGEEAIEWGRANLPAVIVLSVEPRKVGYAICNKLKRSPSLRDVPLILISSEETLATFEQHKKLKSRADEYLLKPLDMQDFVAKVDRLVGLGAGGKPAGADDDDEIHEIDADSDILIADDDEDIAVVASTDDAPRPTVQAPLLDDDEEGPLTPPPVSHDTSAEPVLSSNGAPATFEGERFDPETQAAFAALEAGAAEGPPAGNEMVDLRNLWSDDDLPAALNWDSPTAVGKDQPLPEEALRPDLESTAVGITKVDDPDPDAFRTGETLGPERMDDTGSGAYAAVDSGDPLDISPPAPEEVSFDEAATEGGGRVAGLEFPEPSAPVVGDGHLRELQARNTELEARIQSLENERQTLRKELEEARERFTQSATFSKEREFLGLREIINKKEKDILDLRDGMDAKERQILDHKDKIRELDRARRDLEEKSLGFEKSVVAANERVSELAQDREKSVEREKGLKARLDDAHEELRRAREEVDVAKRRLAHEETRLRAEADKVRAELEGRLVELDENHAAELARVTEERQIAETAAGAQREADLLRLDSSHKAELEVLQRRLAEEQGTASERLASEVAKLRKEHEKAVAGLREEQAAQLASERQAYEALTEAKERDHRTELLGLRRRHEEELAAAEERRQRDIAEQEARRVSEFEGAESRRRAELQARDEEQHARITDIERRHLTEKTAVAEKHRSEQDQVLARAARAEGELAARAQELEQAYRRLASLEADIDAARAELGDREVRLAQSRDGVAQLEAKVAGYEDQIVRAYQRIRSDEKIAEKTRRALAVALALIDERGNVPAAAPVASAMPAAAPPKPAAEESELKT